MKINPDLEAKILGRQWFYRFHLPIAPNLSGVTDWGSDRFKKEIVGCLAIVDESGELAADNKEANTSPITLFPSLPGLLWLLRAVDFEASKVITHPVDTYEQLASGKRVMVAAYNRF